MEMEERYLHRRAYPVETPDVIQATDWDGTTSNEPKFSSLFFLLKVLFFVSPLFIRCFSFHYFIDMILRVIVFVYYQVFSFVRNQIIVSLLGVQVHSMR